MVDAPFGVRNAPAPWKAKVEAYWLLMTFPKTLPKGVYHPLELGHAPFSSPDACGPFEQGYGMIQVVRYISSPIDSYDELLLIPGDHLVPKSGKKRLRISRIYVSTRDALYNGRRHWNIPKHLARFEFSHPVNTECSPTPRALTVNIYPPSNDASVPFFSATLTPFRALPYLPFNSSYLPLGTVCAQPPLPAAGDDDPDKDVIIGTSQWAEFKPQLATSRAKGMWVEVHNPKKGSEDEVEAGRWWPLETKPWSSGLWFEDATLDLTASTHWE